VLLELRGRAIIQGAVSATRHAESQRAKWSGRQDSNSDSGYDHQELATRDSQGDSQSASAPVDPELKRVIDAWQKLPISLRGAIMAIVDLNCPAI
jgi:hypothetical protein